MRKVQIVHATEKNWYKLGEKYVIRSFLDYDGKGVRVWREEGLDDLIFYNDYIVIG